VVIIRAVVSLDFDSVSSLVLLSLVSESELDSVDRLTFDLNLVLFNLDLVFNLVANLSLMFDLDLMLMNSSFFFSDSILMSADLNLVVVSCVLMTVGASIESSSMVFQISDG
jgi:hypothetical protein